MRIIILKWTKIIWILINKGDDSLAFLWQFYMKELKIKIFWVITRVVVLLDINLKINSLIIFY